MSIKSTHLVTRELAVQYILRRIIELDNETLQNTLEEVLGNRFYNFRLVSEEELTSDYNSIKSISELERIQQ